ncbi:PepSY domain-containing protein [Micromonospora sp. HUAS LYJ1]|uniref:PepSY domain-containing protein n=1 Tax=Micromonospora sp. HUAS LYJ1 TaxID=3061626 RepID=UPI00267267BF|nr:PepSY domain-containing protein [Micromonospora sp. HUAS LYJ1]WKU05830.1 PepSY domain-containing protein [Micromonospora sp. HUAS LYJ1]
MKRTSLLLAAAGGAAVLAVTGTAIGVSAAQRAPGPTAATTAPAPADPTAAPTAGTPGGTPTAGTPGGGPTAGTPGSTAPATDDAVSRQRAGEIALAKVGGGRITEIEREREEGRPVWSVEIINGDTEHEIEVDRENGGIVKSEQEKADADDRSGRDDDSDDD